LYVQSLLDVYNKYHAMVQVAFKDDKSFLQALDKVSKMLSTKD